MRAWFSSCYAEVLNNMEGWLISPTPIQGHVAGAIVREMRRLGLEIRERLNTGECEILGDKLSGIAVHTGARVDSMARAGEALVSGTVKGLVARSGITFEERGIQVLNGLPGEWHLYTVASG